MKQSKTNFLHMTTHLIMFRSTCNLIVYRKSQCKSGLHLVQVCLAHSTCAEKLKANPPVPFSWAPSALLQLSSGMGTPVVPQRSSTVLPRMVFTLATDVCTTGLWHFLSSTWLKNTPARLRGVKHFSLGSMKAMLGDWKFRKCTISYRLQSHTQGLSCKPVKKKSGHWVTPTALFVSATFVSIFQQ